MDVVKAGFPEPGDRGLGAVDGPGPGPSVVARPADTDGAPEPAQVVLRLFAAARQAAGTGREEVRGATVQSVLSDARARHGHTFGSVLDGSRVWLNGEPASSDAPLSDGDEIAVLPPVSGGVW